MPNIPRIPIREVRSLDGALAPLLRFGETQEAVDQRDREQDAQQDTGGGVKQTVGGAHVEGADGRQPYDSIPDGDHHQRHRRPERVQSPEADLPARPPGGTGGTRPRTLCRTGEKVHQQRREEKRNREDRSFDRSQGQVGTYRADRGEQVDRKPDEGDERERALDEIDTPDRLGPVSPPGVPTANTSKPQDEQRSEGEHPKGVEQQADQTDQIHNGLDSWAFAPLPDERHDRQASPAQQTNEPADPDAEDRLNHRPPRRGVRRDSA